MSTKKVYKLAYFVSHAIQYQVPLLKELSNHPEVNLKVYFLYDTSFENRVDIGFGKKIEWDIPLLEGYDHEILPHDFSDGEISFSNPKNSLGDVKKALLSQDWDAVWFHGYGYKALLYGIWLCARKSIPFFFRAESNLCCTSQGLLKDIFIRWLVRKATGLLWISTDNYHYYKHYGAQDHQLFFVPYAVDNAFFQEKTEFSKIGLNKKNRPVILYASKFIKRKHAPMLLEAFLESDIDAELWFIGDGEDMSRLQEILSHDQAQKIVKLLGFKNQTELPGYFAQCDVFVLPSEKEPFGLIINEVMNASKAIITTNEVGSARDLIKDGENGWVINAGDKNALKEALVKAIANKEQLQAMGQKSLDRINKWSYKEDICGIVAALKGSSY